jgi:Zn-dependent protease/CBS domain-containing protein
MQKSIRIGKLAGIRIEIHPTWFIIFFLITFSLYSRFAAEFQQESITTHWTLALAGSLLFFGSVLFHEMSHSLMAKSLNRPVEAITLFVFGGVSWIKEEATSPKSEFLVTIVGPLSSFLLAAFFFLVSKLFQASPELYALFQFLWTVNVALGIFNLVPAFPLDGGRVLRSILWKFYKDLRKATKRAAAVGTFFGYLLIVSGIMIGIGGGNLLSGLWLAFIGWFLANAAESSVRQMEIQNVFSGVKAGDIVAKDCPAVPETLSISELINDYILPSGNRCFMVVDDGQLAGVVSLHELKALPREKWSQTTVADAMKRIEELKKISPDDSVQEVLKIMDDQKINQVPVVEGNRLIGIITRERLLNILRTRIMIEEAA